MKFIHTDNAPKAVGPYSQAVKAGGTLYCSGQVSIDPATNELKTFDGDVTKQTAQVLKNLAAVLEAGGSSLQQVIKTTVFLKDMNDFGKVNAVYAEAFGDHRPARACVEAARLPKDVLVEIDAIALVE